MPNWCENELILNGNYARLKEFFLENKTENEELSFEKSVPYPNGAWDYNFCCSEWGTKWDASDIITEFKPENMEDISSYTNYEINYLFMTAWGPPLEWLIKVSDKYKDIDFKIEYSEGGNGFAGINLYSNGMLISEEEYDYDEYKWLKHEDEIIDYLIEELELKSNFPRVKDLIDFKKQVLDKLDEKIDEDNEDDILYKLYEAIECNFSYYDRDNIKQKIVSLIDDIINNRIVENKKLLTESEEKIKNIPDNIINDVKELIVDNLVLLM